MPPIALKLFAAARDIAGADSLNLELGETSTVSDIRRAAVAAVPALGPLVERSLIAVNSRYAADNQAVSPADEVALIPPVSGG